MTKRISTDAADSDEQPRADPEIREISEDLDKTRIDKNDPSRVTRYAIIPIIVNSAPSDGGVPSKYSKQVKAMIDTGATGSAVSGILASELHLEVVGSEIGIGMDGKPGPVPLYLGHITVPDLSCHWNRQILMQTGGGQGVFDVIIGNDILQSCVFTVYGPNDRFTLRYVG